MDKVVERMTSRLAADRGDSDTTLFLSLLYFGELLAKAATCGLVASVNSGAARDQYRFWFRLVRADGVGEWSTVMDEVLIGPTGQSLQVRAQVTQRQLTERLEATSWQHQAVSGLIRCMEILQAGDGAPLESKVAGRRWFSIFAQLRNRTRGHGSTTAGQCSAMVAELEKSILLMAANLDIFKAEWAHLHRNMSGKYRVSALSQSGVPSFEIFRSDASISTPNGVYIALDRPTHIPCLFFDPNTDDLFFPNGAFNAKTFETLSYVTNLTNQLSAKAYLTPAEALPNSETHGQPRLDATGAAFSNAPSLSRDYVSRTILEDTLLSKLSTDRHEIVTLNGPGGIGKTSLALRVLNRLSTSESSRFDLIIWFSARDIDLLASGPKPVGPHVVSIDDFAREFVRLVEPSEASKKGFRAKDYLASALAKSPFGPTLFVFDNFETTQFPNETYRWIDTHIRQPNKALITTRIRDFVGDYPLEVRGMSEAEARELISRTAAGLGVSGQIAEPTMQEIIRESEGHPYVIKVLISESAKSGGGGKPNRVVASREDILEALFERTHQALTPAAQRVFLTLCAWKSAVPELALEAVLLRSSNERIDVIDSVDELRRASFIEVTSISSDNEADRFILVPLAAQLFGRKKLATSPYRAAVELDLQYLTLFGATQRGDLQHGVGPRVDRLFSSIAGLIESGKHNLDEYRGMLELVARRFPSGWLSLARLEEELGADATHQRAANYLRQFLESGQEGNRADAWKRIADLSRSIGDPRGELQALVELCADTSTDIWTVSAMANRITSVIDRLDGALEREEVEAMLMRVIRRMEVDRNSLNSDDLSRLAWLYINCRNEQGALTVAQLGCTLDPANTHCRRLVERLSQKRTLRA